MSHHEISRRNLLQSAAAGVALGVWGLGGNKTIAAETPSAVKITEPFHGAVLNRRYGKQTADGLTICVSGQCQAGDRVTVNGLPARVEGTRFDADVVLREQETDLVAVAQGSNGKDGVRVVWDRCGEPRYRFQIDDNAFFLRDITQKNYASLFDCHYLKILRDLHDKYGAKFTLNTFYRTVEGDFEMPRFPDRYKSEWRDNAHWLRLAFHAYCETPDRPYTDAPPEKLIADLDLVAGEIRRFAGDETYVPPSIVHFGMTRHSAFKPLYERGVRTLSGYFTKAGGRWDINYNWDNVHSEYLSRHNAWKHFDSGMVFSRISIVCNTVPLAQTVATLEPLAKDPNTAEIMDLLTHEQYFWPFYHNFVPDHAQRLDAAIRWCTEQGYKPIFCHEGVVGGWA